MASARSPGGLPLNLSFDFAGLPAGFLVYGNARRWLFTEHFCNKKDDDGSEKASAPKEIYQGVAGGSKHGWNNQCNHRSVNGKGFDGPAAK